MRLPALGRLSSCSLYVHIPFCGSKCSYCDFYSVASPGAETVEAVLRSIEAQAAEFGRGLAPAGFSSIYVGGGTPTSLAPRRLAAMLAVLGGYAAGPECEFSVEVNPETITRELIDILDASPVNRLSVGVQSFDPALLNAIGRCGRSDRPGGSLPECVAGLDLLVPRWKRALSLDLMYGLPGQSAESAAADASRALEYAPEHVSLYALTIEENTALAAGRHGDGGELVERQRRAAARVLKAGGLSRYEISNYARPGKECRHNLGYWRLDPYAGAGPSAVSTLPDGRGGVLRITMNSSLAECAGEAPYAIERIDRRSFMKEHFIMGLRTAAGLDCVRFRSVFDLDPRSVAARTIERFSAGSVPLVSARPGHLRLTARGLDLADTVLRSLLAEIDELIDDRPSVNY